MMEKILTVSVALYNLENLIEKNLKSFVNLKNKDLVEVIVTDDGLKDKSPDIVKNMKKSILEQ